MIERLLARFLAWLQQRSGVLELTEPLIVPSSTAWLRIAPGEPAQWFSTEWAATYFQGRVRAA